MRKPLFVANWKMNHGLADSLKFITRFQKECITSETVEAVICPPFTSLYTLSIALSENPYAKLGAQNCHHEVAGAYTGEISPLFLKELECEYVLAGHSERRSIFGETNSFLNKKVKAISQHNMTPIYCVGESASERQKDKTIEVITQQLSEGLSDLDPQKNLVIAYEPVWAIGTGNNATAEQAEEIHAFIRSWLTKTWNIEKAKITRILYGGSVKADNIKALMKKENIDGALIGGASLEVDSFIKIIMNR